MKMMYNTLTTHFSCEIICFTATGLLARVLWFIMSVYFEVYSTATAIQQTSHNLYVWFKKKKKKDLLFMKDFMKKNIMSGVEKKFPEQSISKLSMISYHMVMCSLKQTQV